jgi:hypothetical protein
MSSIRQATVQRDGDALEFARSRVEFDTAELISDRAWARTYRLRRGESADYLKIVPQHQARVLGPIAALARHFPRHIPRVIALDAERGWLLSAAHGGQGMKYGDSNEQLLELAKTYATLQAEAASHPALFSGVPQPDICALPELLIEFLRSRQGVQIDPDGTVGAEYFIGGDDAALYQRALRRRLSMLEQHLKLAMSLPLTVNHGDLRPPNAALKSDHSCVILDWDDVMVGPAGMSLHGLFGGCTVPTILLSGSAAAAAAASTPHGVLVRAYVDTLVSNGYCSASLLQRGLPAAICAGMIQFIINFAKYPGDEGRSPVAGTLRDRLADLLNLCDLLASRDASRQLEFARDYEDHEEYERAEQLLNDYVLRHPADVEAAVRLAGVQRKQDHPAEAAETYRVVMQHTPDSAAVHAGLGAVLMEQLQVEEAEQHLRRALALEPGVDSAREDLERILAIRAMQMHAAQPDRMPTLRIAASDTDEGLTRPELVALGASLFDTYGTMQIDNAFPVEMIRRLHESFMTRYSPYFREADHPDALYLGDKRYMLTVELDDPFSDPELIGAPMVLPIVRSVLGDNFVLGAYTAVISLPGSADQRLHKDHPPLFPDTQWHHTLPSFAVQMIIPLVPLNEFTGTTRFYKGSHRVSTDDAEAMPAQNPVVPLGSCILNDYRCAHRGLGNRSEQVRPILTLVFNRRWFRDFKNYEQQPPLRMSDEAYEKLPDELKPLLSWWSEARRHESLRRARVS